MELRKSSTRQLYPWSPFPTKLQQHVSLSPWPLGDSGQRHSEGQVGVPSKDTREKRAGNEDYLRSQLPLHIQRHAWGLTVTSCTSFPMEGVTGATTSVSSVISVMMQRRGKDNRIFVTKKTDYSEKGIRSLLLDIWALLSQRFGKHRTYFLFPSSPFFLTASRLFRYLLKSHLDYLFKGQAFFFCMKT